MKKRIALSISCLMILPAASMAQSEMESAVGEVEKALAADLAYTQKHGKPDSNSISKDGSHEFWSNGGPMKWTDPSALAEFDQFELTTKVLKVISLADGVAVALYRLEGSITPDERPAVLNYHTRVMTVYVKEDGRWKVRARHFSPAAGGEGTSSPAE